MTPKTSQGNYLEILAKYDKVLSEKIVECRDSLENFSKLIEKGEKVENSAVESVVERVIEYNGDKLRLYKSFPELVDYLNTINKSGEQK